MRCARATRNGSRGVITVILFWSTAIVMNNVIKLTPEMCVPLKVGSLYYSAVSSKTIVAD